MRQPHLFLGALGSANIYQADAGYDDDGALYQFLATTDRVAIAGIGGEVAFYTLYVIIEYEVANTPIRITPIVDDVALDPIDFVLVGDGTRKRTVIETALLTRFPNTIPNYDTLSTFAPRGTWIQVQIASHFAAAPAAFFRIDGVEIEHEIVQEGKQEGANP